MQKELEAIWPRRREVVRALAAAAAEGDRSENAEYIYRKKELGGIDRRIRYLQKRLPQLKVVRERPKDDAVYFSATVLVQDENGEQHEYRIVGADETDTRSAAISVDSPAAKALLGKRVGDEVEFTANSATKHLAIVSIRYEDADPAADMSA